VNKSLRTCFTCMSPGMSLQMIRSGELSLTGFTLEGLHTWKDKNVYSYIPTTFGTVNEINYFWIFKSLDFFVVVTVTAPPSFMPTHYRKSLVRLPSLCSLLFRHLRLRHPNSTTLNKHPLTLLDSGGPAHIVNSDPVAWHYWRCVWANMT